MAKQREKTKKELRKFGFVMTVPLALIGGFLLWKGRGTALYVLAIASFFLLSGLFVPQILRPIEKVWMKLAMAIGAVMNRVILTLTYFLAITPLGLFLRLTGKDLLQIKFDESKESYWVPVEPDGPGTRPDKPY